jgi:predicted phage-related endonuclease
MRKQMSYDEWQKERSTRGGGSEVAAILGMSRWQTALDVYNRKVGLTKEKEPTRFMDRGTELERNVVKKFMAETSLLWEPDDFKVHDECPYVCATSDGKIWSKADRDNKGVLECKVLGLASFGKTKREGVFPEHELQMQQYLEVHNREWGRFGILGVEDWELLIYPAKRDREIGAQIVEAWERFFKDHVEKQIPPLAEDRSADIDLPDPGGEVTRIETPEWIQAVEVYLAASQHEKEAIARKKESQVHLQTLMSEAGANVAEGAGLRAYWKHQVGRKVVDKGVLKQYCVENKIDIEQFMKLTKASRPFRAYDLLQKGDE